MYSGQRNQAPTINELNRVQVLIEICLQHYMSRNEVVDALHMQANVDPTFTKIVWQKLKEQNHEFFKAYNLRLMVKDQITQFNTLLEMHCELVRQTRPAEVAPLPRSSGSHVPPLHFDSGSYAPFHSGHMDLPNTFFNDNVSHNTPFAQNSTNVGMIQGVNGPTVGPTNVMLRTSLQGAASHSFSEQILRNLSLSDFASFANNSGDKNSFDEMFVDGFDQSDFGSD